ncbi:testis-specific H1 histone [Canis lupus familiaris]|uniref:testis-specific H1 histone n=1 Tax=Canis lupus familiaris TaxID=9615 RepID=UPI0018F5AF34|nr:testis-specific H1 histone [Canis lupus familiaris]
MWSRVSVLTLDLTYPQCAEDYEIQFSDKLWSWFSTKEVETDRPPHLGGVWRQLPSQDRKVRPAIVTSAASFSFSSRRGVGSPQQRPRRGGSGAMAEVAGPTGDPKAIEVKTQLGAEKTLTTPPRRGPRSVLKVSQLLLRAITAHKGLTLAALKKEFGNAGYEVRRKCCRPSGEAPKSDVKGTLLRVSGRDASGYFRVWKTPKPKRKPGRPRLAEGARSSRRSLPAPRSPRRRSTHRRAAKKAREVWRRSTRANARVRKIRARAKDSVRSRAREEARAKVMEERKGRTLKEDNRPRTREERSRPGLKPREEKQQDQEKPVKRTLQKTTLVKTDRNSSSQGKTHEPRAARTKTSMKCESARNAAGCL